MAGGDDEKKMGSDSEAKKIKELKRSLELAQAIQFGQLDFTQTLVQESIRQEPDIVKVLLDFTDTIHDFRSYAEGNNFLSHYFMTTQQVSEINDQVYTQKIDNNEPITGAAECDKKGVVRVAHYYQTKDRRPIANTLVKIQKGEVKDIQRSINYKGINPPHNLTYTKINEDGSTTHVKHNKMYIGTGEAHYEKTNADGIATFKDCDPNATYIVTLEPNLSKKDYDSLYDSYQDTLKAFCSWLIQKWGATQAEAEAAIPTIFATPKPTLEALRASSSIQQIINSPQAGLKTRWQTFLNLSENQQALILQKAAAEATKDTFFSIIKGIWDIIVEICKCIISPKEQYNKYREYTSKLIELIADRWDEAFLALNDKGFLFIVFSVITTWILLLDPESFYYILQVISVSCFAFIIVAMAIRIALNLAFKAVKEIMEIAIIKPKNALGEAIIGKLFFDLKPLTLDEKILRTYQSVYPRIFHHDASAGIPTSNFLIDKTVPIIKSATPTNIPLAQNIEALPNTMPFARSLANELNVYPEVKITYNQTVINKTATTPSNKTTSSAKKVKTHGEPVSMVTGEELLTLIDTTLEGLLPFTWQRLYRSTAVEENKGLGFGWSHSLCHSLTIEGEHLIWCNEENLTLELPLPTEEIPVGINNLSEAAAYLGKASGEYILVQADGQGYYHFKRTASGFQLESISDKYNNRLYLRRDITGKINRIHNGAGRALLLRYQGSQIIGVDYQQEIPDATYEQSWKTLQTVATYHYNDKQHLIKATNALGESEHYRYDEHNVIQQRTMAGGAAFFWQWEGQGKQARCIEQTNNFQAYPTQYHWDDENGTVTVKLHDGTEEVYTHDQDAKLIKQINRDGGELLNAYDENGNLIVKRSPTGAETLYQYDQDNQLRLVTAPDGNITQYGYDNGHVNRIIQGEAQWLYERNSQGDITQQTDPQGNITHYHYTETGKIQTIHYPDSSQHLLTWNKLGQLIEETLPQGGTRRYRYDSLGNQTIRQDERNQVTQFTYDAIGRLSSVSYPDKTTKQFKYNAYGKITETIDEQGRITRYNYLPNLHKISAKINPDGSQIQYQYNSQLNLTGITNEQGERYHLDYYPNGLISQETGFDGRKTSYQYDLGGNLIAKTDYDDQGKEHTTTYLRSPEGKLLQKTLPDGKQIKYGYNGQGLLTSVDDEQWPLNYEYDITGKLTAEHQGWATLRYQYSPLGILSQCKLPDGNVIDYKYQKGGQLAQINLNDQKLTEHFYSLGQEVERQQGSLTSQYDYDEQGRLKTHFVNTSQKNLYQRKYQYSANGNLAAIEDSRKGIRQYHYDPLDRLVQVRGDISEDLIHDPAGNLLAQDHKTQQANVKGNRLLMQGDKHFTYDSFGNLIQEARGQGQKLITQYQYDSQQQLIQATMPDGISASYQYDAFGRRISKTVTDKTGQQTKTEFIWIGEKIVAESSKGHYQTYLYEPDTYKPLALLKGKGKKTEVYYYQLDHLGTPQELTAANGAIAWSAKYKAYGNLAVLEVNELEQPLRFQGQYHDLETGLYYNRNRYYSPDTGRYITLDPIKLAGGLNSYQYTKDPVNWIDPLGLMELENPNNQPSSRTPEKEVIVDKGEPTVPRTNKDLTPEERRAEIDRRSEIIADKELQKRENATAGAHYREKHGSQTTLESQRERATSGRNPSTGEIEAYEDGTVAIPTAATKYNSSRDQLNAINRAELIFKLTGKKSDAQKPVEWGRNIGEGYKRGSLEHGTQTKTQTILNNQGKAKTSYPKWEN